MKKLLLAGLLSAVTCLSARAIPTLQLDGSPATYDNSSETTISTTPNFTLYALLQGLTPVAGDTYYIAASLQPATSTPANLGSFVFGGTTVNVTSDMTYGSPTSLPPHGVYPTYYKLFAVNWSTGTKFTDYDVSLVTGNHTGPTANPSGTSLFTSYNVNVSGLSSGYTLWFDLIAEDSTGAVVGFSPFSHAAQTGGSVPDGGTTMMLLGIAMCGLGAVGRKLKH